MKAGSTSIHDSLKKNGFKSVHATAWSRSNLFKEQLPVFKKNDVFSGGIIEQELAKQLHNYLKNIKLIIMHRNDNGWVNSYRHHKKRRNIQISYEDAMKRKIIINNDHYNLIKYLSSNNIPYIEINLVDDNLNTTKKLIQFLNLNNNFTLTKSNQRNSIWNTYIDPNLHFIKKFLNIKK